MAKAIDTLQAKEAFTAAGFEERKAKALVDVMSQIDDDIASKKDILLLQKDIENLEARLTNKIYSIGLAIAALVVGMNVLF